MYKRNYLEGMTFGDLFVLREAGRTKDRHISYECVCTCGNHTIVSGRDLKSGHTTSCGCKQGATHGCRRINNTDRLYFVWRGMISRCRTKTASGYQYYGARGIRVCDEWLDYSTFKEWAYKNGYDDKAESYKCTIDRIDVNGNYEPSNCRFVDMKTQNQNKRAKMDGGDEHETN